jgi:hypothetical protein
VAQIELNKYAVVETSTGLGEMDFIVPNSDTYTVRVALTLPSIIQGQGQSAVVTTVKVNSTTYYTSNAGDFGLVYQVACSAGDTLKVITASSNANDNAINAVKVRVAISEGGSL